MSQNEFDDLSTLGRLLSAILAVVFWPLLLFGITSASAEPSRMASAPAG